MRILYHHRIRSKDGQYVHIEQITGALRKLGHEVILVGPGDLDREEFGADAGIVRSMKASLPKFLYELLELSYAFVAYIRLVRAVRRHRPDCLYERYNLFLPSGVWTKRRFKLPMLLEVNAPLLEERSRFGGLSLRRLARWSESYTWRGADFVLPVTRVLAGYVERQGVPEDRIAVLPNGAALDPAVDAFAREEAKHRLGVDGKLVLGFIGFVRPWHSLDRVLDFMAREKDGGVPLHLLVVGDGPARSDLERHARDLGIGDQVTFAGVVARQNIAEYLAAFDIALQPDVVAYASPLKLFEYMAASCAIVAPAKPNIQEILADGENAVLFDPNDPFAFAGAVERACKDAPLRERIGRRARRTLVERKLTWQHNAEVIVQLFDRLRAVRASGTTCESAPARAM